MESFILWATFESTLPKKEASTCGPDGHSTFWPTIFIIFFCKVRHCLPSWPQHHLQWLPSQREPLYRCHGKVTGAVKRGAECHTDHQLLQIKVKVVGGRCYYKPHNKTPRKFDVSVVRCNTTDDSTTNNPRHLFQKRLNASRAAWKVDSTVEKWTTIKAGLIEATTEVLGREQQRHPDC